MAEAEPQESQRLANIGNMASPSTLHEEVLRRFLLGMGLMLLQQPCFQLAKARHLLLFIILNRVIIFEMFVKYFSIKLGFILDSRHFLTTPLNTFFSISIVSAPKKRPEAVTQLWKPRLVILRSRVRIRPLPLAPGERKWLKENCRIVTNLIIVQGL